MYLRVIIYHQIIILDYHKQIYMIMDNMINKIIVHNRHIHNHSNHNKSNIRNKYKNKLNNNILNSLLMIIILNNNNYSININLKLIMLIKNHPKSYHNNNILN